MDCARLRCANAVVRKGVCRITAAVVDRVWVSRTLRIAPPIPRRRRPPDTDLPLFSRLSVHPMTLLL